MSEGSDFSFNILTAGAVVSSNCPSFIDHINANRNTNDITKLAIINMKKLLIYFEVTLQNYKPDIK